jgi:LAO/AO transport system kinase
VTVTELADRVRAGDLRALARAITLVENESPSSAALVAALHPHGGRACLIGLTGPPGAGKSTLVDALTRAWRQRGSRVGIVAVDPSSPFTGGALLGDRVRMQQHAGDRGVFIRSMATRGHLGGLARATDDVALVLDAAGFDIVLIETVGVGQDEIEVVRTADIAVVVLVPGTGDDVQALKAGIMEIADLFVVNKADREGADRAVASIEALLSLRGDDENGLRPAVVSTEATAAKGIDDLVDAIERVRREQGDRLGERRRQRASARLRDRVSRLIMEHLERDVLAPGEFDAMVDRVAVRELDLHAAARALADRAR